MYNVIVTFTKRNGSVQQVSGSFDGTSRQAAIAALSAAYKQVKSPAETASISITLQR